MTDRDETTNLCGCPGGGFYGTAEPFVRRCSVCGRFICIDPKSGHRLGQEDAAEIAEAYTLFGGVAGPIVMTGAERRAIARLIDEWDHEHAQRQETSNAR